MPSFAEVTALYDLAAPRRTAARAAPQHPAPQRSVARSDFSGLGTRIDWDSAPAQLRAGDLSTLDQGVARAISEAAAISEVRDLADQLGLDPVILVIGLMARAAAARSRSAARIAHAIFGHAPPEARLDAAARVLWIV